MKEVMKKLTLYSMNGCAQCVQAAKLLEAKGVAYIVVKIDEDFDAWEFLKKEGHRSMPQLYLDGKLFVEGGFKGLSSLSDADLHNKLK
jgi:glutaredoxin